MTGKLFSGENPLLVMIQKLKDSSNYDQRKADIETFNNVNTCFFLKINFLAYFLGFLLNLKKQSFSKEVYADGFEWNVGTYRNSFYFSLLA